LFLESHFEAAFESMPLVGGDLLVTGILLAAADRVQDTTRRAADLGVLGALAIGAAQALAILPGISRSGATICMALFLGLDRKEAARFSFLLSVPAILGAAVLKIEEVFGTGNEIGLPVVVGTLVAFVSGIAALQWLIHVLNRRRLIGFAAYCWLAGIVAIAASFLL